MRLLRFLLALLSFLVVPSFLVLGSDAEKAEEVGIGIECYWSESSPFPPLTVTKGELFSNERFEKSLKYKLVSLDEKGRVLETRQFDFETNVGVAKCLPGKKCPEKMIFRNFLIVMKENPNIVSFKLFQGDKEVASVPLNAPPENKPWWKFW